VRLPLTKLPTICSTWRLVFLNFISCSRRAEFGRVVAKDFTSVKRQAVGGNFSELATIAAICTD